MLLEFVLVVTLIAVDVSGAHLQNPSVSRSSHQNENSGYGQSNHHKGELDVVKLIERKGYPAETYVIKTEDGYILDLIRIPHGLPKSNSHHDSYSSEASSFSQNENNNQETIMNRMPVLLLPGMVSNAEDYVLGEPHESLAFLLADHGYDVYLGNVRGSKYGRKHSSLNPDRDAAFWRFCWDDIALKDLPAIIDEVLRISRKRTLSYIGHMQGSTIFYVLGAKVPEYNDKVSVMVTLGPLAFLSNTRNVLLKLTSSHMHSEGWVIKNLGQSELKLSHEAMENGGAKECKERAKNRELCENSYFLLNGYNSHHINERTILPLVNDPNRLTGTSTRGLLHMAQLVKSGRFTDYRNDDVPLSNLRTPTYILYTLDDMMSTPADVETLIEKLPNVQGVIKLTQLTNNLDLLFGHGVENIVNKKVLHILSEQTAN